MKKRITLFTAALVLELIQLFRWFSSCVGFKDELHIYAAQISEYLTRDIHNEQHTPLVVVRLFYNKLTETVLWTLKPYLRFYDVSSLISLLTLVGCIGFFLGVWFLVTKKHKPVFYVFPLFLIVLPLLETLLHPSRFFTLQLLFIAIPFALFSLYGLFFAIKETKAKTFLIVITSAIFISILFFVYSPTDLYTYCIAR